MKKFRYKKGLLVNGNCLKLLPKVKAESVDLVFADPPFNIGYQYDSYHDKQPKAKYLAWTKTWVNLCRLVLKPTGSMFVAIGDDYAANLKLILDDSGLHFRNWIIWRYRFGVHCNTKFGRDHTHILYYTKAKRGYTFNAGDIRVRSLRQTKYRDKRANPAGRVPGDVWTFPRVCGTHRERVNHPCQMPEAVLSRIIRAASNVGDVVLDPFAGSGTTLAVSRSLARVGIGFELSKQYFRVIKNRLSDDSESENERD